MRRLAALLLLAAAPNAASAQTAAAITAPTGRYAADGAHTSVTFRVRHLGLSNYTARFAKVASSLDYDAADPTRSRLEVAIDARSVRTDFPFPDRENFDAKVADFIGAAKTPELRFVSRAITRTGPASGVVTGDLTMNGQTHPVTLTATFNGAILDPRARAPRMGVSARGVFKRRDWGAGAVYPAVGDEVEVQIEAEYVKN